jgi:hypothetical protein
VIPIPAAGIVATQALAVQRASYTSLQPYRDHSRSGARMPVAPARGPPALVGASLNSGLPALSTGVAGWLDQWRTVTVGEEEPRGREHPPRDGIDGHARPQARCCRTATRPRVVAGNRVMPSGATAGQPRCRNGTDRTTVPALIQRIRCSAAACQQRRSRRTTRGRRCHAGDDGGPRLTLIRHPSRAGRLGTQWLSVESRALQPVKRVTLAIRSRLGLAVLLNGAPACATPRLRCSDAALLAQASPPSPPIPYAKVTDIRPADRPPGAAQRG